MPLDGAAVPKTLTSTLHYLKRGTPGGGSMRYEAGFSVPRFR